MPAPASPRPSPPRHWDLTVAPYGDLIPPIHLSSTFERAGDGSYPGGTDVRPRPEPGLRSGRGPARRPGRRQRGACSIPPAWRQPRRSCNPCDPVAASWPRASSTGRCDTGCRNSRRAGGSIWPATTTTILASLAAGTRGRADRPAVDRDPGQPDLGDHRHPRGGRAGPCRRDPGGGGFHRGDAGADPSAGAGGGSGHALGHQVSQRSLGPDRRRAGDPRGQPGLAAHPRRPPGWPAPSLGPMEAWLLLRGMRTLHLRVRQACASALRIARTLANDPRVLEVRYPGLPSHPGHAVAVRQMTRRFRRDAVDSGRRRGVGAPGRSRPGAGCSNGPPRWAGSRVSSSTAPASRVRARRARPICCACRSVSSRSMTCWPIWTRRLADLTHQRMRHAV